MLTNIAKNRFHAALAHLLISALVAFTLVAGIFYFWYSLPILEAVGAKKIFIMIIVIDVCIGPFLTLIVFNKKKKELNRDLSIIFMIQIIALGYGLYTITTARPAYMVFTIDRFEIVAASEIDKSDLKKVTRSEYKSVPLTRYKWVSSQLPENLEERNDILFTAIDTGKDLAQLPQFYAPLSYSRQEIIKRTKPLDELFDLNKNHSKIVSKLTNKYQGQNEYGFLPLTGRIKDLIVVINKHDGTPVEIIALQPW